MIVTVNDKIVFPAKKVKEEKKPLMSKWFKKWLVLIIGLFILFLTPAILGKPDEGLALGWMLFFLFCLMIYGIVVLIQTMIAGVRKFLKFRMVIYY